MKNVVLYDLHITGHHLSYLCLYASVFNELGCKVTILTTEVNKVADYILSNCDLRENALDIKKIDLLEKYIPKYAIKRNCIINDIVESYICFIRFLEVCKNIKHNDLSVNSIVILMWFDEYVSKYLYPGFVSKFIDFDLAGLWFHPCHVKYAHDTTRRCCDTRYKVPILGGNWVKHLGLFDELAFRKLRLQYERDIFQKLPDVAEKHDPDMASPMIGDILSLAGGRKIVSLVGSLDRRKNLVSFFESATKCTDSDLFFVCAGVLHKETFTAAEVEKFYHLAAKYPDKIYFYDRHIESNNIFDALLNISDVVVAVYSNFTSSSNIIAKSANHGKYVVVSDEFLMGDLVKNYRIGVCVRPGEANELGGAIRYIIDNHHRMGGRFDEFVQDHSRSRLKECLIRFIS